VNVKYDEEEATFKQLKKFGDTLVLYTLNSRYEDIELKKGCKLPDRRKGCEGEGLLRHG